MSIPTQPRDTAGQFASPDNSGPEMGLSQPLDIEGFRETLRDFLEGSLPGFGFQVPFVDVEVDAMVDAFIDSHIDD